MRSKILKWCQFEVEGLLGIVSTSSSSAFDLTKRANDIFFTFLQFCSVQIVSVISSNPSSDSYYGTERARVVGGNDNDDDNATADAATTDVIIINLLHLSSRRRAKSSPGSFPPTRKK